MKNSLLRTIVAPAVGLALIIGSTAGCSATAGSVSEGAEFEFEDCDREDALKGQRDECSPAQIAKAKAAKAAAEAKKKAATEAKKKAASTKKRTGSSFGSKSSGSRSSGTTRRK